MQSKTFSFWYIGTVYIVVVEKCNCCNLDFPGFFLQFIDTFGNYLAFFGVFADFKAMKTFKRLNLVLCIYLCFSCLPYRG